MFGMVVLASSVDSQTRPYRTVLLPQTLKIPNFRLLCVKLEKYKLKFSHLICFPRDTVESKLWIYGIETFSQLDRREETKGSHRWMVVYSRLPNN